MPNVIRTENNTYQGYQFESAKGYIRSQKFVTPLAATTNTILNAAEADAGGKASPLNQPDIPRTLVYVADGAATGVVTVHGKDINKKSISETKTLNGNTPVSGGVAFASIDNNGIDLPTGAYDVSIGLDNGLGLEVVCPFTAPRVGGFSDEAADAGVFTTDPSDVSKNFVTPADAPDGSDSYTYFFFTTGLS